MSQHAECLGQWSLGFYFTAMVTHQYVTSLDIATYRYQPFHSKQFKFPPIQTCVTKSDTAFNIPSSILHLLWCVKLFFTHTI